MRFELREEGSVLVVKPLSDELGFTQSVNFQSKILDLISEGHSRLLIDMNDIGEIDSSGISALIHVALNIQSSGGKLACFNVSKPVLTIMQLTHVDNLIPVFQSREEALKTFTEGKKQSKKFDFFVEDPKDFESITALAPKEITCEKCQSVKVLREKVQSKAIDAVFIADTLFNQEMFEFSDKIYGVAVVILLRPGQSIEMLQTWSTKAPYARLVELPLTKDESQILFEDIIAGGGLLFQRDAPIPEKLLAKYAKALPEKLKTIEGMIQTVATVKSKEVVTRLREEVHKLSGSAGSYGYIKAGEACKGMEIRLRDAESKENYEGLEAYLKDQFKKIKFYFFAAARVEESESPVNLNPVEEGSLFVASDDPALVHTFQKVADSLHRKIDFSKDARAILADIGKLPYKPQLVLVESEFGTSNLKGLDIIEEVKSGLPDADMKFCLVVSREDLDVNVKAARMGVDLYKKPISISSIEKLFESLLVNKTKAAYRVLVVDDDEDVCNYVSAALNSSDVTVRTLTDERKILDQLYDFQPDLLLLDINMPTYDGWALLATLRRDVRYKNLKIVMITAAVPNEIEKKRDLFDDLWIKPLNDARMKQEVSKFALATTHRLSESPAFATFLSKKQFIKLFQKETAARLAETSILVIIGSREFKIAEEGGVGTRNEFLISSENLINSSISGDVLRGYLGNGYFALFFNDVEMSDLKKMVEQFIVESEYKVAVCKKDMLLSAFSAAIIPLGQVHDAEALVQDAIDNFEKNLILPSQTMLLQHTH